MTVYKYKSNCAKLPKSSFSQNFSSKPTFNEPQKPITNPAIFCFFSLVKGERIVRSVLTAQLRFVSSHMSYGGATNLKSELIDGYFFFLDFLVCLWIIIIYYVLLEDYRLHNELGK